MKQKFDESKKNQVVKLSELKQHPQNPRINNIDREIYILKNSLEKSGQLNNIIIDENGVILSGNRRFQCANMLGWEYIKADIYVNLTDLEKKSFLISTNTTQKNLNLWANRDLIAKTYWDEFLKEFKPTKRNDFGYEEFAKLMGCSKTSIRTIIEASKKENKPLIKELRQNNFSAEVVDKLIQISNQEHRNIISKEIINKKRENPSIHNREIRTMITNLKRELKQENKDSLDHRDMSYLRSRILSTIELIKTFNIDKATLKQKKELLTFQKKFNKLFDKIQEL